MGLLTTLEDWRKVKEEEEATYDDEVLYLLRACKTFGDAMPPQPTETDYLRASSLHDICPREFVLNYWQPQPNRSFDMKSQFMMGMGTHIHDYVQNCILGPMGVLHGEWSRRMAGEWSHDLAPGFHPDPELAIFEIANQKPLTWRYTEPKVWTGQYRISGHVDGVVSLDKILWLYKNKTLLKMNLNKCLKELDKIDAGEYALFELKVSGTFVWDKISGGSSIADYYKTQANIYQKLMKVHKTVFWYINRNTIQSKAFVYNYDEKYWTTAKRKSRIIWTAIRDEVLPDSMKACMIPTEKRARACTFGKPCWDARLDFEKYVADGKERAAKEGRILLDLSELRYDDE